MLFLKVALLFGFVYRKNIGRAVFLHLEKRKGAMKQKLSIAALLLAACLGSCREAAAPQQQIGYSVLTVEPSTVTLTESYSASVRGRQDIEIYPQVSGTIQRVCVKEGEKVRRGQSLFVIDRVPYEAALRTAVANVHAAEAQVETARITFESKQELFRRSVVSEFDLSTARNALAVAEASLEQARAEETNARNSLSYTEVKTRPTEWSARFPIEWVHWSARRRHSRSRPLRTTLKCTSTFRCPKTGCRSWSCVTVRSIGRSRICPLCDCG